MKKLITSLFALAVMTTASAQMTQGTQARVYAYDLKQAGDDVKTVTFKTNTKANTAVVTLSAEGQEDITFNATSNDGVNWSAEITPSEDFGADVEYNWSVEVSADAVESFQMISDHSDISSKSSAFRFYRSFGLVCDKSPESDYFGRSYAVNQATNTGYKARGMFVYNPQLDLVNSVSSNLTTGVLDMIGRKDDATTPAFGEPFSGSAPADMCIAEDGRIFMTNVSTAFYGVYYINPETFMNECVFQNVTRKTDEYGAPALFDAQDNRITSIKSGIAAFSNNGEISIMVSESHELYYNSTKALYTSPMNVFEIGKNNTWSTVPTTTYSPTSDKIIKTRAGKNVALNRGVTTFEGTKNGFWAVQSNRKYASTSSTVNGLTNTTYTLSASNTEPYIFYYNRKTGMAEYTGFEASNASPALAVNDALGIVAYTLSGTSNPMVMKYYEDEETGELSIETTETFSTSTELGNKADAMDFDYAGNLWAVTSGNEKLAVYALPDALVGPNTRVTPAKKDLTISYTQGEIEATGIETIESENAPVEYYNLQGVKVENPENGIFIKKQGRKTTKVIL